MFTPQSTARHLSQENANVTQRKQTAVNSVRKAFADRPVNQNQSNKKPLNLFPVSKPQPICKPTSSNKINYPSYFEDVCTKKEINDVLMSEESPFRRNTPKTPPPTYFLPPFDPPEILNNCDFLFEIPRDESYCLSPIYELEEPKVPEFNFDDFNY